MITLHGGRLSPYVRRVALWLERQGVPYERDIVNVFGEDFDAVRRMNPLGRVPVLSIGEDEHLIETWAITDYLEEVAPAGKKLVPAGGKARRECLQRIALASAIVDKGVALVYEKTRRAPEYRSPEWRARLVTQISGGLVALEALVPHAHWFGGAEPDGADIAVVCTYDFLAVTNPFLLDAGYPRLAAISERANRLPMFADTYPAK